MAQLADTAAPCPYGGNGSADGCPAAHGRQTHMAGRPTWHANRWPPRRDTAVATYLDGLHGSRVRCRSSVVGVDLCTPTPWRNWRTRLRRVPTGVTVQPTVALRHMAGRPTWLADAHGTQIAGLHVGTRRLPRIATALTAAVSAVGHCRWRRPLHPNAMAQLADTAAPCPYGGNGSADGCPAAHGWQAHMAGRRTWHANRWPPRRDTAVATYRDGLDGSRVRCRSLPLASTFAPQRHGTTGGHGCAVSLRG